MICSGQLTFFICSIEMIKLLNRAWSSLHIASSVFSCMDSMTITTAWNQKSVRLRDHQNIVPDSPHTPVHGGNGVPPIPLGTWRQKKKLKIGLEEIEKLHKDPKWCQKLTLETWNWKVMKNIWSAEHILFIVIDLIFKLNRKVRKDERNDKMPCKSQSKANFWLLVSIWMLNMDWL